MPLLTIPTRRSRCPCCSSITDRDGCEHCKYADHPPLMDKLTAASRKEPLTFEGGSVRNPDPCEAFTHHSYLRIQADVVAKIAGLDRAVASALA